MTEQLGLEKRVWERAAIQGDERKVAACAEVVDRVRDQFLTRAGLALDQSRRIVRCDSLQLAEHLTPRERLADEVQTRELPTLATRHECQNGAV